MLRPGEPYLRGRPLDVDFLGFRSDTYTLQRAGWQFAERSDHYNQDVIFAIKHPDHHISGMSRGVPLDSLLRWTNRYAMDDVVIRFELAIKYMIHQVGEQDFAFFGVDTAPSYQVAAPDDLYDMPYFKPIDEGKEIFLRKASVEEIMQIALDKQEPEQARIRASRQAEARREEYSRGGTTKAKLIMVA